MAHTESLPSILSLILKLTRHKSRDLADFRLFYLMACSALSQHAVGSAQPRIRLFHQDRQCMPFKNSRGAAENRVAVEF